MGIMHSVLVKVGIGRIRKHSALNKIVQRTLASLHIPSKEEPTEISRSDGKRVDELTILPWERGKSLLWDATCADTLAPFYVRSTGLKAGAAAELAVKKKNNLHKDMIHNYIFVVLAVETLGPWSKDAKDFIDRLGSMLNQEAGDNRCKKFLKQPISIAIRRGNVASILGTLSVTESLVYLL